MTIETTEAQVQYVANGASTSYAFDYGFIAPADLKVTLQDPVTGTIVTKAINTDYTVAAAGVDLDGNPDYSQGGAVLPLVAASFTNTHILTILRDPEQTQSVDTLQNDNLPVEDYIERPLDKLTMIAQALSKRLRRAMRLDDGDTGSDTDMLVPPLPLRINRIAAWDGLGKLYGLAGYLPTTSAVSAFIETLLTAADAAAARLTLGAVSQAEVDASIAASGSTAALAPMQCRLNWVSTSSLRLDRFGGNKVTTLDGSSVATLRTLPATGPTLAPTALSDLTLYYVYLYWDGADLQLEASATAPAFDATTGLPVKNGDPTRVLVGAAFPNSSQWQETDTVKSVASYWNRRRRTMRGVLLTDAAITATSATELSSDFRVKMIQWADSLVTAFASGRNWNDTSGAAQKTLIAAGPEGGAYASQFGVSTGTGATATVALANVPVAATARVESATTRILRLQLMGIVSSGTGTWDGHATDVDKQNVLFADFEG